ncbi:MAG: helix-turn-helix domain-containing protein [Candidatus Xenobium sp.]
MTRPAIDPDRLKTRRTALRITRSVLGKSAGVSARTIQNYEEGNSRPAPGILLNLAQALGVSEEWLCGEDGEMNAPRPHLFSLASSILALSPEDRAALLRLLQSEPHPAG